MAAKLVTGIAKVTQKILKASRVRTAAGLSKVSSGFAKAASRARGALGKLTALGTTAVAASAISGKNTTAESGQPTSVGSTVETQTNVETAVADPIIVLPDIVPEDIISDEVAERVDLTVTRPIKTHSLIKTAPIVEGYFDDDRTSVPTEFVIPEGTEIEAISNSVGALSSQIKALQALTDSIDAVADQNEKTKRDNEKRRDEEDVEKKEDTVFRKSGEVAGVAVGGFLAKWLVPAITLGFAGVASAFADSQEGNEETISDMADDLSFLEGIEEKYAALTVALGTAGLNVRKGFQAVANTLSAKSATFVQKMSAVSGQAQSAYQKAATTLGKLSQVVSANPVARAFIAPIRALAGFFSGVAGVLGPAISQVTAAINKLPKFMIKFFKGFLAKPLKYLAIFEIIDTMIDALMAFMFNSITEEEFHTRTKKNINDIVGLIGGTWITTIIFTAVGTAIGSVVPIFGNVAGMILGVVMGVLFGEDVYKIIGGDDIVDAIYDYFFLNKKTSMKDLAQKILDSGKVHLQKVIDEYTEFFKSTFEYFTGEDKIESAEGIEEKFGADASLSDIALQSSGVLDDDENAMMYVADNINSEDELKAIDAEMLEKEGKTLKEYAQDMLSSSEYQQFETILNASIAEGAPPPPSIQYPVSNAETGEIIGLYNTPEEAAQFAMQNNGTLETPMVTKVADIAMDTAEEYLNPEAVETVRKIQKVFNTDEQPIDRVKTLYESAINIAEDGNYEEVKQVYTEITGRDLKTDMTDMIGDEEAKIVDSIMSAEPEEVAEIVADAGLTKLLETALPDVSSEIKEKATQIIPIITQLANQNPNVLTPAGSSGKSQVESATPTFNTSDPFVTFRYQT